jgi:hypothetical protein
MPCSGHHGNVFRAPYGTRKSVAKHPCTGHWWAFLSSRAGSKSFQPKWRGQSDFNAKFAMYSATSERLLALMRLADNSFTGGSTLVDRVSQFSSCSWSLSPPCGTCHFAPNICSSLPKIVWHDVQLSRGECGATVVGRRAPSLWVTRARLMASQDTVLSVPAGSN